MKNRSKSLACLITAALLVKNIRDAKIDSLLCGGAGGFTGQKFITKAGKLKGGGFHRNA
jgi:hypothetical protein